MPHVTLHTRIAVACAALLIAAGAALGQGAPSIRWMTADASSAWSLGVSPDGSLLAEGSNVYGVMLWNTKTGIATSLPTAATTGYAVAFSKDGKTLVISGSYFSGSTAHGVVETWALPSLTRTHSFATRASYATAVSISADGKTVVSGGAVQNVPSPAGVLEAWNSSTGAQIASLPTYADWINEAALEPDNATLVCAGSHNNGASWSGNLELWSLPKKSLLHNIPVVATTMSSMAISPKTGEFAIGARLVAANGAVSGVLHVYSASGVLEHALQPLADVPSLVFSPDGSALISGETFNATSVWTGAIEKWRVSDGTRLGAIPTTLASVNSIAYTPDGKKLFAGGWNAAYIEQWTLQTNARTALFGNPSEWIPGLALTPDGSTLISGGSYSDASGPHGALDVWNAATGSRIAPLPTAAVTGVNGLAISPDGANLAVVGFSGTGNATQAVIEIWNVARRTRTRSIQTMEKNAFSVAYSPDGSTLLVGGAGAAELFNAATGAALAQLNAPGAGTAAFSPDGKTLALGNTKTGLLELWDVASRTERAKLSTKAGWVLQAAFSRDGKTLAAAENWVDSSDKNHSLTELWNVAAGTLINSLDTTDLLDYSVAYPPDGTSIFVGNNYALQVYSTANDGLMRTYDQDTEGGVTAIAFSSVATPFAYALPNGTVIVADNAFALALKSLVPSLPAVTGGGRDIATITLLNPAPAGGARVALASDHAAVIPPQTVSIAAGKTSAQVVLTTGAVAAETRVTLVATCDGTAATATVLVDPKAAFTLSLSPTSVKGGGSATATVTLAAPAPTGGLTVNFACTGKVASLVAPSALIPAGSKTATVKILTTAVTASTTSSITAAIGSTPESATLKITP